MDSNSNTVVVTAARWAELVWLVPDLTAHELDGSAEEGRRYLLISEKADGLVLFFDIYGFGPFRQYLVNSSWEAVKELSKRGLGENIDLQVMQLPVVYQKAKEQVIKIWTTLQPLLTVHVGLASSTTALILLEQCGKNKGYQERDACGFQPEGACCMLDGPEKIESAINMKTLWKNISVEGIEIMFSRDAGRYVCDYTYYTSLYYGNGRAAFIHVPPLSKSVTADFLGKALHTIILAMLEQCGVDHTRKKEDNFLESNSLPLK